MNRRLILLNLALIALAAWLGWVMRQRWLDARAHERATFEQAARVKPVLPPSPIVPPKPVTPAEYIDVAQRTLFAKDRNPNVIVDAPPPPPPPPPMPALPSYYGQMRIDEPLIVLTAASNEAQKSYHTGDKVGPFEIVSFDSETIALKWKDKIIERPLAELAPKEAPPDPGQRASQSAPQAAQPKPAPQFVYDSNKPDSALGADMGGDFRGCVNGENSAPGTVVGDFKKVVARTMMGVSCHWERVSK